MKPRPLALLLAAFCGFVCSAAVALAGNPPVAAANPINLAPGAIETSAMDPGQVSPPPGGGGTVSPPAGGGQVGVGLGSGSGSGFGAGPVGFIANPLQVVDYIGLPAAVVARRTPASDYKDVASDYKNVASDYKDVATTKSVATISTVQPAKK